MPSPHQGPRNLDATLVGGIVYSLNVLDQVLYTRAFITVLPLPVVSDTPYRIVQSHRTAVLDVLIDTPLHASLQQIHPLPFLANAVVELVEIDAVFERAVACEIAGRDFLIVLRHAHGEAQMNLGVWIEICGAQFENVAETLTRTVLAGYATV